MHTNMFAFFSYGPDQYVNVGPGLRKTIDFRTTGSLPWRLEYYFTEESRLMSNCGRQSWLKGRRIPSYNRIDGTDSDLCGRHSWYYILLGR